VQKRDLVVNSALVCEKTRCHNILQSIWLESWPLALDNRPVIIELNFVLIKWARGDKSI